MCKRTNQLRQKKYMDLSSSVQPAHFEAREAVFQSWTPYLPAPAVDTDRSQFGGSAHCVTSHFSLLSECTRFFLPDFLPCLGSLHCVAREFAQTPSAQIPDSDRSGRILPYTSDFARNSPCCLGIPFGYL